MKKTKKQIAAATFPYWLMFALAAVAVPRAVVHDLRLISFDSILYTALAIIPWLTWLVVALFWKTKKPLRDFIIVGLAYGLLLALTHQLLWDVSWGSNPPELHGNLENKFDPAVEAILLRTAAFISSIVTGLVAGLAFGLVATGSAKIRQRLRF